MAAPEGQIENRGSVTVVVEIGNTHDGSLGNCFRLMDAVASAGADAIKMQCHLAWAESSKAERFPARFQFHPQDATRFDYWQRMQFTRPQWEHLAEHANELGLEFIVSPFSVQAVDLLAYLPSRWKIASGEIGNLALLDRLHETGGPYVISGGMSPESVVWEALFEHLKPKYRESATVLQCTTQYPCPLDRVGLNKVAEYSTDPRFLGGLSDHSGTIWPGVAAALVGAHMVEVHICWDRRQFGADASSSLTIAEFSQMAHGIRAMEVLRSSPVEKDEIWKVLPDVLCYTQGKQR